MSSSTSSSSQHRRYVIILTAITFIPASLLFALGVYLQPLQGDLTRVGMFSERDFGWNKPQVIFKQPLYTSGLYRNYHDIVVLGDSFSWGWPEYQWQNYLAATTGASIMTLDIKKTSWQDVLRNPVFLEAPPKLLIVSMVERLFPLQMRDKIPCTQSQPHSKASLTLPNARWGNLSRHTRTIERNTHWNDVKLEFVWRYIWKQVRHGQKSKDASGVKKVRLTTGKLFSSENREHMLILADDIAKSSLWRNLNMSETTCTIEKMRQQVEANGKTRFVLLLAPDKLTAYADHIHPGEAEFSSQLSDLASRHAKVMPRIDLALTRAIHQGKEDVYLPNDTHWGSNGHRVVATTLLDFLKNATSE